MTEGGQKCKPKLRQRKIVKGETEENGNITEGKPQGQRRKEKKKKKKTARWQWMKKKEWETEIKEEESGRTK